MEDQKKKSPVLALQRKLNEEIILEVPGLDEPITIILGEIYSMGKARIVVKAPKAVKIWRAELLNTSHTKKDTETDV